jgi:murein DD-endopeptidase MepM/ murein hydrolase activator NlpD
MKPFFPFLLILLSSCGVQHHFASREDALKDSSYVYTLPYPPPHSYFLLQGYNSWFSHRGRLGLDFPMKKGSPVTAARSGIVVRVQQAYTRGGIGKRYSGKANHVIIRHNDGSQAYYGHLQYQGSLVKVGDTISIGDTIALSGSTGFSALPHLHFIVWGPSPRGRAQLPTRFHTSRGVLYLKPGRRYKNQ